MSAQRPECARAPSSDVNAQRALERRLYLGEQWLARRILKVLRIDALAGVTDSSESRKERFRTVILERGAALEVAAHSGGHKAVLFGEAFEQLYGERLLKHKQTPGAI